MTADDDIVVGLGSSLDWSRAGGRGGDGGDACDQYSSRDPAGIEEDGSAMEKEGESA